MIIFLNFVLFGDRNNPFERPRGIDLGASCHYCRYLIIVLNNPIVVFLIISSAKVVKIYDLAKYNVQIMNFFSKMFGQSKKKQYFCTDFRL